MNEEDKEEFKLPVILTRYNDKRRNAYHEQVLSPLLQAMGKLPDEAKHLSPITPATPATPGFK
jgi:hypothetical protein